MSKLKKPKFDIPRSLRKFTPNYTLLYTLVFLLMSVVVFHYFITAGKVSVWYYDGKTQNYNTLVYIGTWFRDLAKNIFINHNYSIPTYTFSIGYGGDIVQFLHFYVLGDPFNLLSVFVPSSWTIVLFHFLIVLRLYCAGLAFSKMCLYFNKNIDRYALLAGALTYVFGSYALISVTRHPYFVNPMIYLPLIILGLEKIRQKESPVVFVFGVFLSIVSNFYFLFQIAVFSVLYFIGKMIYDRKKYTAKENLFYILQLGGYSVLAAAMSGAILLPIIGQAVNDPRLGVNSYIPLVFEPVFYQQYLKNFIASDSIAYSWTNIGMGGIIIPSLYALFTVRKKRTYLKVIVVALVLFSVIPFFGHIFNGISYVSNRWIWVLALPMAYVIAVTAEDFAHFRAKDYLRIIIILAAYFAICVISITSFTEGMMLQIIIALAAMTAVISLGTSKRKRRYAGLVVAAAVLIGICVNSYYTFSPSVSDFMDENCNLSNFNTSFNANEANLLSKKYKDDEFSRYSGTSLTLNASLNHRAASTQFYYSLSNSNMFELFSELNSNVTIGQIYRDLDDSTYMNALANVKYFTLGVDFDQNVGDFIRKETIDSDKRVPYGYDTENVEHWAFTSKGLVKKDTNEIKGDNVLGAFSVYKNKNFLPFGYTYSGYIPRSEYSKLSPIQKQEALLQGVVLDENTSQLKTVTPESTSEKINYTINTGDYVTKVGKKFISTKNSTKVTFDLEGGLKNSETYVHFKNIDFTPTKITDLYNDDKSIDPEDQYTQADWNALSAKQKRTITKKAERFQENSKVIFKLSGGGMKKTFDYRTKKSIYYQGRRDFLINFNYSEKPKPRIVLTLPVRGVYSFDDIQIYSLPMDKYEQRLSKLKKDVLTNVDFHNSNASASTNEITGEISLKENKLLCLTIPYTTDWKAYVDGKEAELVRANTAFSGILLTKGNHKIRLVYDTAGFKVGLILSVIGFAALIPLVVIRLVIRKKRSS
ncbi:MAG: YfhO family protein [Ruminococcus sp.]|nr:YfhO family protein [Ruminococcus sp.]